MYQDIHFLLPSSERPAQVPTVILVYSHIFFLDLSRLVSLVVVSLPTTTMSSSAVKSGGSSSSPHHHHVDEQQQQQPPPPPVRIRPHIPGTYTEYFAALNIPDTWDGHGPAPRVRTLTLHRDAVRRPSRRAAAEVVPLMRMIHPSNSSNKNNKNNVTARRSRHAESSSTMRTRSRSVRARVSPPPTTTATSACNNDNDNACPSFQNQVHEDAQSMCDQQSQGSGPDTAAAPLKKKQKMNDRDANDDQHYDDDHPFQLTLPPTDAALAVVSPTPTVASCFSSAPTNHHNNDNHHNSGSSLPKEENNNDNNDDDDYESDNHDSFSWTDEMNETTLKDDDDDHHHHQPDSQPLPTTVTVVAVSPPAAMSTAAPAVLSAADGDNVHDDDDVNDEEEAKATQDDSVMWTDETEETKTKQNHHHHDEDEPLPTTTILTMAVPTTLPATATSPTAPAPVAVVISPTNTSSLPTTGRTLPAPQDQENDAIHHLNVPNSPHVDHDNESLVWTPRFVQATCCGTRVQSTTFRPGEVPSGDFRIRDNTAALRRRHASYTCPHYERRPKGKPNA